MELINFENTIKPEEVEKLKVFEIEKDNHKTIVSCKRKDDSNDPSQILYQERYEIDEGGQYYLLERIYYNKDNPNSEKPVYKETFEPNQEDHLEGSYVSCIKDPDDNFIGYRYYSSKQTDKSEPLKKCEDDFDNDFDYSSDSPGDETDNNSDKSSNASIEDVETSANSIDSSQ